MTLLILAAGLGSRYGGMKQLDGIGPCGELIIDYSVHDAIEAGFDKVVFIIKEENLGMFKEKIGDKISAFIKVDYAFQSTNNVPAKYNLPEGRKPLGTGHAILCAKDVVGNDDFVVINADDFYGKEAFKQIAEHLNAADKNEHCMVAYQLKNTVSENGTVSRGICSTDKDDYLTSVIENEKINKDFVNETATPTQLSADTLVSMNFWGFRPSVFEVFEKCFCEFLETNKNDLSKCEFYLTIPAKRCIDDDIAKIKVLGTTATWYGVTYIEDRAYATSQMKAMADAKLYPERLWA